MNSRNTSIVSILEKIYINLIFRKKYKLDKNENIIIESQNELLGTKRIIKMSIILIVFMMAILTTSIIMNILDGIYDNQVFLNRYNVQEICIENDVITECFSSTNPKQYRLYLDEYDSNVTLRIKED